MCICMWLGVRMCVFVCVVVFTVCKTKQTCQTCIMYVSGVHM